MLTEEENVEKSSKLPKEFKTKKEQNTFEEQESQRERKKENTATTYDTEADWERIFVANIENSKTIPYISLLKFKFMQINFRSDLKSESGRESEITVKKTASINLYTRLRTIFAGNIETRRRRKIEEVFNVDEGPSNTDYDAQLGLEFWSSYCNIEKNTLKESTPNGFWDRKEDSYRNAKEKFTQMMDEKKGFLKRLWSSLGSPVEFLKGVYEPVRAPQKVISPEEKFRVQSFAKIKRASEDIIPPKEYKTYAEKIEKQILKVYKFVVDLWGGKWPRIRTPTLEEIYDDTLIWILDIKRSKERILAILNDRIKKEII